MPQGATLPEAASDSMPMLVTSWVVHRRSRHLDTSKQPLNVWTSGSSNRRRCHVSAVVSSHRASDSQAPQPCAQLIPSCLFTFHSLDGEQREFRRTYHGKMVDVIIRDTTSGRYRQPPSSPMRTQSLHRLFYLCVHPVVNLAGHEAEVRNLC